MDNESFDRGIKILCATYQGFKVDADKLKLYRILLSDLDSKIFLTAVVKITRTVKELYPGSNLIAIIHENCKDLTDPVLMAEEAWLQVLEARGSGKYNIIPDFENEIINNSVRVVGWKSIYYSGYIDYPPDKLERLRSSFIRTFKSYQGRYENDYATEGAVKLLGWDNQQEWLE